MSADVFREFFDASTSKAVRRRTATPPKKNRLAKDIPSIAETESVRSQGAS